MTTMFLQTISNEEALGRMAHLNIGNVTNKIDDIEGTHPEIKEYRYTHKPDYYYPDDIEGSHPKQLHRAINAESYFLRTDDIPYAQSKCHSFTTNRHVNPIDPYYKLPSCKIAPAPVPKFIRDNIQVDDIEGTKPGKLYPYEKRDIISCDDIVGSKPGWKPRYKQWLDPPRDILNVKDITGSEWTTSRHVNPLEPKYKVGELEIADEPRDVHPRPLPKEIQPDLRYTTQDIEGSITDWKPMYDLGGITISKRKDFRETNNAHDIKGAQHDTVHWKLRTNRVVDPLDPQYIGLDGVPLDDALYRCPTPPNPTSIPPVRSTEAVIAEKEFELRNLSQEIREMRQTLKNTTNNSMNNNTTSNGMNNSIMSNTGSNVIGKPPRDPSIQPVQLNTTTTKDNNNNNNNSLSKSSSLNNSLNNSNRSSRNQSNRSSARRSQTLTPNMSRHSSQNISPQLTPLKLSNPVSPINIEKTIPLNQTVSSVVSGDTSKPIVISHRSNTSSKRTTPKCDIESVRSLPETPMSQKNLGSGTRDFQT